MEQESIYNLIPKEYIPPPRDPRYKSTFPPKMTPTGSTFINHTTSRPGVANVPGEFELKQKVSKEHKHRDLSATMGKPRGESKPDTKTFRLKGTGSMGSNKLPEPDTLEKFVYETNPRRPPIPKRDEKPILGLKSNKNFIVSNAVENILSAPKVIKEETVWTKKKDYGKTPEYLQTIKSNIESEYKMIQNLHMNEAEE
jgi:hypothetical protein